jgi:hypothetical protein
LARAGVFHGAARSTEAWSPPSVDHTECHRVAQPIGYPRFPRKRVIMKLRTRHAARISLSCAVGAALLLMGAGAASATTRDVGEPAAAQDEQYLATDPSDRLVGDLLVSDLVTSGDTPLMIQAQAAGWIARVNAHNAHKSSGQASGHVSWTLVSGAQSKLKVSSTLKARTSWVTFRTMVGPVPAVVAPGGGRGNAAVARYDCRNSSNRDWYTYGEIFAPGAAKAFGSHSSSVTEIACDGGLS